MLWTAVETGFSTIHGLEADVGTIKTSIESMTATVEDLKDFAKLMMKELTDSNFDQHHASSKGSNKQPEAADTSPLGFE